MAEKKEGKGKGIERYFEKKIDDGSVIKKGYSYGDNFYGIMHLRQYLEEACPKKHRSINKRYQSGEETGDVDMVFNFKDTTVLFQNRTDNNKLFLTVMSSDPERTGRVFDELEKMTLFKNPDKIAVPVEE